MDLGYTLILPHGDIKSSNISRLLVCLVSFSGEVASSPQLVGVGVEFSVFGVNQPVFKGFYGNSGAKYILPLAETLGLYDYTQLRKCLVPKDCCELGGRSILPVCA